MKHPIAEQNMHKISVAVLFLVAIIWGGGFVFSKVALEAGLKPGTVMFIRFALAALFTGVVFRKTIRRELTKGQWKAGAVLGGLLFGAFYVQIIALQYTTPANNAFITGTYVVLVPLLWWVVSRRRPPAITFFACALSFAGVSILSYNPAAGLRLSAGDMLTLFAALLFAAHIVATSIFAKSIHHVVLIFLQFTAAAAFSLVVFLFAGQNFAAFKNPTAWVSVLYLGLMSIFVCYLLQTWAQKHVSSAQTGVVLATEALFGSMFSVLLGFDALTPRMVVGGLMMFLSIILPELWGAIKHKATEV